MTLDYTYVSSAIVAAQESAQMKACNSFSYRELRFILRTEWQYLFSDLTKIDPGYFSLVRRLTHKKTTLPSYIRNSLSVFRTPTAEPYGKGRIKYKQSSVSDMEATGTFNISGMDLYVPDVERYPNLWLEYIPQTPDLSFTKWNRDPKILDSFTPTFPKRQLFGMNHVLEETLDATGKKVWTLTDRFHSSVVMDITHLIEPAGWTVDTYIASDSRVLADFPFIWVTRYRDPGDNLGVQYRTVFIENPLNNERTYRYNAFDYTGRGTNVRLLDVKHNDETGEYIRIEDMNDNGKIKELGWTADTLITFPSPLVSNLLICRLAIRFAGRNQSQLAHVISEEERAYIAVKEDMKVNKAAFDRIERVEGMSILDFL